MFQKETKMLKIGRAFIAILFLSSLLSAKVTAYVNTKEIQADDIVKYTIESDSYNTQFPKIDSIAGYAILASPESSSVQIINGNKSVSKTKSYIFKPLKDVTIPVQDVTVDGKNLKTPSIEIRVRKRAQTVDQPYKFDIIIDNDTPYIGEEVMLKAEFRIDASLKLEALDVNFESMDGFWVKEDDKKWRGIKSGKDVIYSRAFYLYPQRTGKILIPNYPIAGQTIEGGGGFFFSNVKNFTAYSNELTLDVKPLPKGASLAGSYTMSVKTDKFKTTSKEPVNLSIEVEGYGTLDDLEQFKIDIAGVTVYADKPLLETKRKDGKLFSKGVFKYALLSDNNFTIPAFSLTFVDPKDDKVKTLSSNAVDIEVENANPKKPLIIKAEKNMVSTSKKEEKGSQNRDPFLFFVIGAMFGAILGFFLPKIRYKREKQEKNISRHQSIKMAKDSKELLRLLLGFVNEREFNDIIVRLEQGVTREEFKKIKKDALAILQSNNNFSNFR